MSEGRKEESGAESPGFTLTTALVQRERERDFAKSAPSYWALWEIPKQWRVFCFIFCFGKPVKFAQRQWRASPSCNLQSEVYNDEDIRGMLLTLPSFCLSRLLILMLHPHCPLMSSLVLICAFLLHLFLVLNFSKLLSLTKETPTQRVWLLLGGKSAWLQETENGHCGSNSFPRSC